MFFFLLFFQKKIVVFRTRFQTYLVCLCIIKNWTKIFLLSLSSDYLITLFLNLSQDFALTVWEQNFELCKANFDFLWCL